MGIQEEQPLPIDQARCLHKKANNRNQHQHILISFNSQDQCLKSRIKRSQILRRCQQIKPIIHHRYVDWRTQLEINHCSREILQRVRQNCRTPKSGHGRRYCWVYPCTCAQPANTTFRMPNHRLADQKEPHLPIKGHRNVPIHARFPPIWTGIRWIFSRASCKRCRLLHDLVSCQRIWTGGLWTGN
jgi:hypothetical protein